MGQPNLNASHDRSRELLLPRSPLPLQHVSWWLNSCRERALQCAAARARHPLCTQSVRVPREERSEAWRTPAEGAPAATTPRAATSRVQPREPTDSCTGIRILCWPCNSGPTHAARICIYKCEMPRSAHEWRIKPLEPFESVLGNAKNLTGDAISGQFFCI